jgi:60 kDa SS-A/Ro ribonucleoprotein
VFNPVKQKRGKKMNYAKIVSSRTANTSQDQPIPGREAQMAKNSAGGYVFTVSPWDRLDRFLILGREGGTYYVGERQLTGDNAKNLIACIKQDGERVVDQIVAVSEAGRAPKNDPAKKKVLD